MFGGLAAIPSLMKGQQISKPVAAMGSMMASRNQKPARAFGLGGIPMSAMDLQGYNIPSAEAGGAYKVKKYMKGGLTAAQSKHMDRNNDGSITGADFKLMEHGGMQGEPPAWLKKIMSLIKGEKGAKESMAAGAMKVLKNEGESMPSGIEPSQVRDLEQEEFEQNEIERESRRDERMEDKKVRLLNKAMTLAAKEHFGTPGPDTQAFDRVDYSDPEVQAKVPKELVQEQFERLWNRSERIRKMLFKSPETQEEFDDISTGGIPGMRR